MDDLIKPITQLSPGVCKECRSPLNVVLSDLVRVILSENGIPVSSDVYASSIKGVCPKCLHEQPMIRKGLSYVPDTEWGRDMVLCEQAKIPTPKIIKGSEKANPFEK